MLGRYWPFGAVCLGYAALVGWLLVRRRLTLQSSLLYVSLLLGVGVGALLLPESIWFSRALGFEVPSNFVFAMAIGALSLLHLSALITISKLDARVITLVQEAALLEERLERLERQAASSSAASGSDGKLVP